MTTRLRLGPLPKSVPVKLTIAITEKLKHDLDRYAAMHAQQWGDPTDACALIPHMLEAFMARDRAFRRPRSSRRAESTAEQAQ